MANNSQLSARSFWLSGLIVLSGIGIATIVSPFTPAAAAPPHRQVAHEPQASPGMPAAHAAIEIPPGQPLPTVNLVVHPDRVSGWNLEIQVNNFRFAPENLNAKSLPSEGHAHLFVNGRKVARVYSSWFHLEPLPPGRHQIAVSLNANGHEPLVHRGRPIAAIAVIHVPAD